MMLRLFQKMLLRTSISQCTTSNVQSENGKLSFLLFFFCVFLFENCLSIFEVFFFLLVEASAFGGCKWFSLLIIGINKCLDSMSDKHYKFHQITTLIESLRWTVFCEFSQFSLIYFYPIFCMDQLHVFGMLLNKDEIVKILHWKWRPFQWNIIFLFLFYHRRAFLFTMLTEWKLQ